MIKAFKLWLVLWFCLGHANFTYAEHETDNPDTFFNYHWGRGLTIPSANLNIGGYTKVSYKRPENRLDKLALEDLSLFITWSPHDRLRFFAEIELHNWLATHEDNEFSESLSIERLFVDYLISDSTSVRFGKFLTPFGRWNVIHSAPLVWTTNRPVITEDLFFLPWRANGLLLSHTQLINEHNLDLSLYIDDSKDLEPKALNTVLFDKAIGTRINYEISEQLQIGASYLAYQKLADLNLPTHHVFGLDAMWQNQGYELLFESLYHIQDQNDQNPRLEEKGLYIQGVAPITGKVSAVGRYEYVNSNRFQFLTNENVTHIGVAGLAWRPFVPLVFKAEYRFGDNNRIIAPSGLFVSVAMFF